MSNKLALSQSDYCVFDVLNDIEKLPHAVKSSIFNAQKERGIRNFLSWLCAVNRPFYSRIPFDAKNVNA